MSAREIDGMAPPHPDDYKDPSTCQAVEALELAAVPGGDMAASVAVPAWLTAFLADLAKQGFNMLVNFLKEQLASSQNKWISTNGFYVNASDHILLWIDGVDDEAEVMLNNTVIGNFVYEQGGAWIIAPDIKKGLNALVVKLKNTGQFPRGPGPWSVRVIMRSRMTGKDIQGASYAFSGDDFALATTRIFITRFWGQ